jgi:hypothetical protein
VGNSSAGLERELGKAIDLHEVVIRMNAGVPDPGQAAALGCRTDILAVGTLQCLAASEQHLHDVVPVWFWKASRLGDKQWKALEEEGARELWRVPGEWNHDARVAVGARPSGGIGLVHALVHHLKPAELGVFNFDFFGALGSSESWWHRARPKARIMRRHPHDGEKELAYFKRLGFKMVKEGWWRR